MTPTQRNFAIIGALAVLGFAFRDVFSDAAVTASHLLSLLFIILISVMMWQLYRRHEGTIGNMPATWRLLLQVGAVVGYLTLVTGLFWPHWAAYGSVYALAFFVLLFASFGAVYLAWQRRLGW